MKQDQSLMRMIQTKQFYKDKLSVIGEDAEKTTFRLRCGDGSGTMEAYCIFAGIELIFNQFRAFQLEMKEYSAGQEDIRAIEINHCKRGAYRCVLEDGALAGVDEGELAANIWSVKRKNAMFPSGYYYGAELLIHIDRANEALLQFFRTFGIDLFEIQRKLLKNHGGTAISTPPELEYAFHALYEGRRRKNEGYLRIKVMEILKFLTDTPFETCLSEHVYVSGARQKRLHELALYLREHPENTDTIPELAEKAGLPASSLKCGFKDMFGKPLHTWRRENRILRAQELLLKKEKKISEIALLCGYENASKFSQAFRRQTGLTPTEFCRNGQRIAGTERNG